jgi:hypothetical protein
MYVYLSHAFTSAKLYTKNITVTTVKNIEITKKIKLANKISRKTFSKFPENTIYYQSGAL